MTGKKGLLGAVQRIARALSECCSRLVRRLSEANPAKAAYKEARRDAYAAREKATQAAKAAYDKKMEPFTTRYNEICKTGASHEATHQLLILNKIAHRAYEIDVKCAWAVYHGAIEAAKAAYKEARRAATKRNPPKPGEAEQKSQ